MMGTMIMKGVGDDNNNKEDNWKIMGTMKWGFNNDGEKWCLLEPHCLVIRVPKQLLYNYTTIRAWNTCN
jgi:hypothetical protein